MVLNTENFYKKLTTLYVEPNITTAKYFENILKKIFKEVFIFNNFNEAFDYYKLNNEDIDFIICDMVLEKNFTAFDLLKKAREINDEIPFIVTTSKVETDELLSAIKLNINDLLIKPYGAKSLLDSVQKICQTKYYKQTQNQLMKDLEDIFEVVNEVALVSKTDINGNIIFINKSFSEITGYTQEELKDCNHDILKDKSDDSSSDLYSTIKNGKIWEGKVRNISKNNTVFYTYLTVIPIQEESSNKIKEYTWIGFLATEYELKQKEFRKKVIENINKNRRINTEAREKIDELQNMLLKYKNVDSIYELEKSRKEKFQQQFEYFDSEAKKSKAKLNTLSEKAKEKLYLAIDEQDEVRIQNEQIEILLDSVYSEYNLKNKTIKELKTELEKQQKKINDLMLKIEHKELKLGL